MGDGGIAGGVDPGPASGHPSIEAGVCLRDASCP